MAGVDYDDFDGYDPSAPAAGGGRLPRLIHLAGAASSVLLVIGLGVWGYRLAVRDIHGVPVIRAIKGPMRIAPEDPGGTVAAHQGLAVNAIAEAGGVTPPSDTLTLAPRAVELTEGDGAGLSDLPPMTAPAVAAAAAPLSDPEEMGPAEMGSEEETDVVASPAVLAPAVLAPAVLAPEVAEDSAAGQIAAEAPMQPEAVADLPAGALVKSLRPPSRPATRPARAQASAPAAQAAAVPAAPARATPAETSADKISNGTRLVQLGAFDTADQARGEWKRLQGKFPELLGQKSLVVQPAESGGRTFYRLRALGFDGEADARRFCTALLAEGAACIPVTQR